jgi:DNA-binding NarL/FixJ family response regulator
MGLFYSGNGFSLYRFSVINISLTYLYISCSVIVARNCLLPEQARSRAIDLLSLPSMPENDKKIIAMIQRGASNKEIAQELKLTLPTIKHINYRIFSRFNVKCRTELISTLQELGSRENPEAREEQIFGQTENAF